MKINPNPTIRCGGYELCKSKNNFPCVDCWHKLLEKGDRNPYAGEIIK